MNTKEFFCYYKFLVWLIILYYPKYFKIFFKVNFVKQYIAYYKLLTNFYLKVYKYEDCISSKLYCLF